MKVSLNVSLFFNRSGIFILIVCEIRLTGFILQKSGRGVKGILLFVDVLSAFVRGSGQKCAGD